MTKLEKILLILLGIFFSGAFFLFSSGYLTFEFPFSLALGPQVIIAKNQDSPKGFFGSNQYQPLVVYNVKVKGLKKSSAELQRFSVRVNLNPQASQKDAGLRDFFLVHRFCVPAPTSYGYGGLYGFTHDGCFVRSEIPSSIQQSSDGATLTFAPDWNFFHNASYASITLYGKIAYTQVIPSKSPQKVRAEIIKDGIVFEIWRGKKKNGARIPVNIGQSAGNWLEIRSGYGYPTGSKTTR